MVQNGCTAASTLLAPTSRRPEPGREAPSERQTQPRRQNAGCSTAQASGFAHRVIASPIHSMSDKTTNPDGRETAVIYDLKICTSLMRFGWLTSNQLAPLVRPDTKWAQRSVQTRLASLVKRKFVIAVRLTNGTPAYKLAEGGARFLHESGMADVPNRGTRDAKIGNSYHRALGNSFLIHAIHGKEDYWTEYEILRGLGPISAKDPWKFQRNKLIPDALSDSPQATIWIEIENAAKSQKRMRQLYCLSRVLIPDEHGTILDHDGHSFAIRKMYFVCPSAQRVRSVAKAFADSKPDEAASKGVVIYYAPMPISLVWPSRLESATAYDAARVLGFIKSDAALTKDLPSLNWLGPMRR